MLLFTYNEQLLFNIFMHRSIIYHDDKEKKNHCSLLALGLGAVTMFSQFPVSAAEETAQNTDAAAQTADPSVVVTNGIDGWPQASDISSAAAIVMETSTNTVLYSKMQISLFTLQVQSRS